MRRAASSPRAGIEVRPAGRDALWSRLALAAVSLSLLVAASGQILYEEHPELDRLLHRDAALESVRIGTSKYVVTTDFLNKLNNSLNRAAIPGTRTVYVTYSNSFYTRLLANSMMSLSNVNVLRHLVFFALDENVKAAVPKGIESLLIPEIVRTKVGKFWIVWAVLHLGFDFFLLEADSVLFSDPLPHIQPRCDLSWQSDAYFHEDVDREDLNIGVFFARASRGAEELFTGLLETYAPAVWDQRQLNELLKRDAMRLNITVCVLDLDRFQNGGLWFWLPHLHDSPGIVAAHNNFVGIDFKVQRAHTPNPAGAWFWMTKDDPLFYGQNRKYMTVELAPGDSIQDQLHELRLAAILSLSLGRALVVPHITCVGHPAYELFRLHELPWCDLDHYADVGVLHSVLELRPWAMVEEPELRAKYLEPAVDAAPPASPGRAYDELVAELRQHAAVPCLRLALGPAGGLRNAFRFRSVPLILATYVTTRFLCGGVMPSWPKDVPEAGGAWTVPLDCWLHRYNFWSYAADVPGRFFRLRMEELPRYILERKEGEPQPDYDDLQAALNGSPNRHGGK
eukprot:tig00000823_g4540.t1